MRRHASVPERRPWLIFLESSPEAEQKKETKLFHSVMQDAGKAKVEITRFMKENPGGVGSRKKMIDFGTWHRSYGARNEAKLRDRETLVDISEYWSYFGRKKGLSRQESDAEFLELSKTPLEREGEGAQMKLWVSKPKQRFRDASRCHYVRDMCDRTMMCV